MRKKEKKTCIVFIIRIVLKTEILLRKRPNINIYIYTFLFSVFLKILDVIFLFKTFHNGCETQLVLSFIGASFYNHSFINCFIQSKINEFFVIENG